MSERVKKSEGGSEGDRGRELRRVSERVKKSDGGSEGEREGES